MRPHIFHMFARLSLAEFIPICVHVISNRRLHYASRPPFNRRALFFTVCGAVTFSKKPRSRNISGQNIFSFSPVIFQPVGSWAGSCLRSLQRMKTDNYFSCIPQKKKKKQDRDNRCTTWISLRNERPPV